MQGKNYLKKNILNVILYASGIILGTETSLAQDSHPQAIRKTKELNVKGYIPADLDTSVQLGNRRNIGSLNFFIPLGQTDRTLLFADARLVGDSKSNKEGNLGLIYRWQVGDDAVAGGGPFLDLRKSRTGNTFPQLTLNAHFLTSTWQVQGNLYIPSNKKKVLSRTVSSSSQVIPMQGYLAAKVNEEVITYERTLKGADLHVSYAHPRLPYLRAGVSAYSFQAKGFKTIQGWGQRLDYTLNDRLKFSVEHVRDSVRKSNFYAGITWTIPLSSLKKTATPSKIDKLFATRAIRDIDAVTAQKDVRATVRQIFPAVYVSAKAAPGGDGTAERPFQSVEEVACMGIGQHHQIVCLIESSQSHVIVRLERKASLSRPASFSEKESRAEKLIVAEPSVVEPIVEAPVVEVPVVPPVKKNKKRPTVPPKPSTPPPVSTPPQDMTQQEQHQKMQTVLLNKSGTAAAPKRKKVFVPDAPSDANPPVVKQVRRAPGKVTFQPAAAQKDTKIPQKAVEKIDSTAFSERKKFLQDNLTLVTPEQQKAASKKPQETAQERAARTAEQDRIQQEHQKILDEWKKNNPATPAPVACGAPPPPPPPPPSGLVIKIITKPDAASTDAQEAERKRQDNKKAVKTDLEKQKGVSISMQDLTNVKLKKTNPKPAAPPAAAVASDVNNSPWGPGPKKNTTKITTKSSADQSSDDLGTILNNASAASQLKKKTISSKK